MDWLTTQQHVRQKQVFIHKKTATKKRIKKIIFTLLTFFVLMVVVIISWVVYSLKAPGTFPAGDLISIPEGASLKQVAENFENKGLVKSGTFFAVVTKLQDATVVAGDYRFEEPLGMIKLIQAINDGDYGDVSIRVTLPEGITTSDMSAILEQSLPNFDPQEFQLATEKLEGYLFPDTYFFFPSTTTDMVVERLTQSMDDILLDLSEDIQAAGHTNHEILTMASIIEREAFGNDKVEHQTISGVLWGRIARGMLMQVDATFKYYLDKESSEVTVSDLKEDHPYNTYVNLGLPPGPIANPGLLAIEAAVYPLETDYVFYLHDPSGQIHYAQTHDQHVNNKRRYLR